MCSDVIYIYIYKYCYFTKFDNFFIWGYVFNKKNVSDITQFSKTPPWQLGN